MKTRAFGEAFVGSIAAAIGTNNHREAQMISAHIHYIIEDRTKEELSERILHRSTAYMDAAVASLKDDNPRLIHTYYDGVHQGIEAIFLRGNRIYEWAL